MVGFGYRSVRFGREKKAVAIRSFTQDVLSCYLLSNENAYLSTP
jgi:hypothetical protein